MVYSLVEFYPKRGVKQQGRQSADWLVKSHKNSFQHSLAMTNVLLIKAGTIQFGED